VAFQVVKTDFGRRRQYEADDFRFKGILWQHD
jgi:hypothetical protein